MAKAKKPFSENKLRNAVHIVATAIGIVLCVILAPIVVVNLTLVVKSYRYPDKVPSVFGVSPLMVTSGSMEPNVGLDDLIFVRAVADPATLEIGDIISYLENPTTVVTHRIISIAVNEAGEREFTVKGDANNVADENPVKETQLVGKYFAKIHDGGQLAMFMKEPIGMVLFMGVPILLFLLYDSLRRRTYRKKEAAAKEIELENLRLQTLAQSSGDGKAPVSIETVELPPED
jgi:signal peptidase